MLEETLNNIAEAYQTSRNPSQAIEPLYDLDVVAQLVPVELDKLKNHLKRHKEYPRVYRLDKDQRRRRMLPISTIKTIRSHVLRGPDLERFI